jgi:hypothetical protein
MVLLQLATHNQKTCTQHQSAREKTNAPRDLRISNAGDGYRDKCGVCLGAQQHREKHCKLPRRFIPCRYHPRLMGLDTPATKVKKWVSGCGSAKTARTRA